MTVGQIFTIIGSFIENRQIFMLLNCNCTKFANKIFKHAYCVGGSSERAQVSQAPAGAWHGKFPSFACLLLFLDYSRQMQR